MGSRPTVSARSFVPGDRVLLRRPRELAGIIGLVLRPADGGFEVQVTTGGMPYSLVVRPGHLELLAEAPERQVPLTGLPAAPADTGSRAGALGRSRPAGADGRSR